MSTSVHFHFPGERPQDGATSRLDEPACAVVRRHRWLQINKSALLETGTLGMTYHLYPSCVCGVCAYIAPQFHIRLSLYSFINQLVRMVEIVFLGWLHT